MKYRKLRIAWSVAWGVVTVLLCVLWVKSYWRVDFISHLTALHRTAFGSQSGAVWFERISLLDYYDSSLGEVPPPPHGWQYLSDGRPIDIGSFDGRIDRNGYVFQMPVWFVSVVVASISALPWLSLRFSLRTLLIAMTVIAVGLGAMIWITR